LRRHEITREAEPRLKAARFPANPRPIAPSFPGDITMTDKNRQAYSSETVKSVVAEQRKIQAGIDRIDERSAQEENSKPMQAGQREYPTGFPEQHLGKPGLEEELELAPMYEAPGYQGSEKLKGMAALITGADSGIGRAVAVLFAREGADVAIAYLSEDEDAEITKRAVEKEGGRCILLPGDVADADYCREAVGQTVKAFGRLDILVNNAAFQEHASDILDLTEAHFDRTLKTNLYGYFNMAKAAIPHLKQGGSILMTGSVTGIIGSKELLD
jgi:hypothetical protein